MKIIIKKNTLLKGIKFTNSIITQNNFYPTLQSILMIVENQKLYLISSNGLSSSKFIIDQDLNIISTGKILIKAKTLFNVISKLDGKEVLLEQIDNSLLKIKCNKFDSNLNILNVDEYPNIKFESKDWNYIKIKSDIIKEVDKKISPSANYSFEKDSVFNGILFDSKSEKNYLKVIASNTYKMSFLKYPFIGQEMEILIEPNIIKNILDFIGKEDVFFYKKENKIIIEFKNIIISTKNIEGLYPKIDKIINQDLLFSFKINKINLQNLLNRGLSLISNENKPIASFKINKNDILISFKSIEIGFSSEIIEIESNDIDRIDFDINIIYLISLLKSFDNPEIFFYISGINKPILLKDLEDERYIQVLVPLRKN